MADLNELVDSIVNGIIEDLKARTGRNERESLWDALGEPGEEDIRTDLRTMITGKLVTSGVGPLAVPFDPLPPPNKPQKKTAAKKSATARSKRSARKSR